MFLSKNKKNLPSPYPTASRSNISETPPKKEGIKISIFIKLLLVLLAISIIPAVASFFLTASTYQKIIETGVVQEYLPRGNVEVGKELFLAQTNIRVQATLLLLLVIFLASIICFLTKNGI